MPSRNPGCAAGPSDARDALLMLFSPLLYTFVGSGAQENRLPGGVIFTDPARAQRACRRLPSFRLSLTGLPWRKVMNRWQVWARNSWSCEMTITMTPRERM